MDRAPLDLPQIPAGHRLKPLAPRHRLLVAEDGLAMRMACGRRVPAPLGERSLTPARRASRALAGRDPAIFTDPADTEAPYPYTRTLARSRHDAKLLAAHGARHHLAGHGGDELARHLPAYLHSLLLRRPITAIKHVRGHQALRRWPWVATVSALAHGGDLGACWHQQAQPLTTGPVPRRTPS